MLKQSLKWRLFDFLRCVQKREATLPFNVVSPRLKVHTPPTEPFTVHVLVSRLDSGGHFLYQR